jgi:hypothetical protein
MDCVELPADEPPEMRKTGVIVFYRDVAGAIQSLTRASPAALLKTDFDARRLTVALAACEKYWRAPTSVWRRRSGGGNYRLRG